MMDKVAIVGAGQMGRGIAQVVLEAGHQVLLIDIQQSSLDQAELDIPHYIAKSVGKGLISAELAQLTQGRLTTTTDYADLSSADLIIETVDENLSLKKEVFAKISAHKNPKTIIASNTSSLSLTKLASFSDTPENVIGLHFMNPAPLMPLIEIIRGLQTSEETFTETCAWVKSFGKTMVVSLDRPGFIINRLLFPMINEAIFLLQERVASVEEIDKAIRLGIHHRMGPFQIADLVGLDVCLAIMKTLHRELGEDKYRPCPLLQEYVDAGWLGRKTNRGFYDYTSS